MTGRNSRPLPVSGTLAVVAGVTAVLFVADGPAQHAALSIGVLGIVGLWVGLEVIHRKHVLLGAVVGSGGVAGVLGALWWAATRPVGISPTLELLPGILGLAVLVLGIGSAIPGYERWFVTAGTGTILLGVFVSGILYDASVLALLAGTAATVVAWDCGEQAINLGEQIGRAATTWRAEVVHEGGAVVVGGLAVGLAVFVEGLGVSGLPIASLSILIGAGVVLSVALYN